MMLVRGAGGSSSRVSSRFGGSIYLNPQALLTQPHLTQLNSHTPSITPNSPQQCQPTDDWVNKMWWVCRSYAEFLKNDWDDVGQKA